MKQKLNYFVNYLFTLTFFCIFFLITLNGCSSDKGLITPIASVPTVANKWKGYAYTDDAHKRFELSATFSQEQNVLSGYCDWKFQLVVGIEVFPGDEFKGWYLGNIDIYNRIILNDTSYTITKQLSTNKPNWSLCSITATLDKDTISGSWSNIYYVGTFILIKQ